MQGEYFYSSWTVYRLSESCWSVTGSSWTVCKVILLLAELSTGRLDSGGILRFDCSWTVFLVTLLLEYFGECTIRVTVLFLYFGMGSLPCLVHLYSNFNSFLFAVCVILADTIDILITQNRLRNFYQGWVKLHISYFSYLIDFWLPKGTPLMFNLATYRFSACSSKQFTL